MEYQWQSCRRAEGGYYVKKVAVGDVLHEENFVKICASESVIEIERPDFTPDEVRLLSKFKGDFSLGSCEFEVVSNLLVAARWRQAAERKCAELNGMSAN